MEVYKGGGSRGDVINLSKVKVINAKKNTMMMCWLLQIEFFVFILR